MVGSTTKSKRKSEIRKIKIADRKSNDVEWKVCDVENEKKQRRETRVLSYCYKLSRRIGKCFFCCFIDTFP